MVERPLCMRKVNTSGQLVVRNASGQKSQFSILVICVLNLVRSSANGYAVVRGSGRITVLQLGGFRVFWRVRDVGGA
jgi:hypothetical protein